MPFFFLNSNLQFCFSGVCTSRIGRKDLIKDAIRCLTGDYWSGDWERGRSEGLQDCVCVYVCE